MRIFFGFLVSFLCFVNISSQVIINREDGVSQIIYPQGGLVGNLLTSVAVQAMPEHGFLPGAKFPTYSAIKPMNFENKKVKIVLFDDRATLLLKQIECSNISLTNTSEFKENQGIVKVWEYINLLFKKSNLIIDKEATEEYEIRLMALDCRLIGFGQIDVHGLCQIQVKHNGNTKIYCTDLVDGDPTAPLTKSSFVTRKTATRYMASASIRDTIEKIMKDIAENKI